MKRTNGVLRLILDSNCDPLVFRCFMAALTILTALIEIPTIFFIIQNFRDFDKITHSTNVMVMDALGISTFAYLIIHKEDNRKILEFLQANVDRSE